MNEQQFHTEVDKLFLAIEQILEKACDDIDFESEQGMLNVLLPQGGQLILSRQTVLQEVWLACPQGAFHFHYSEQGWVTRQGQYLMMILADIVRSTMGLR